MIKYDYIVVKRPTADDELFFGEPFTKWQAWIDLIFLAQTEDKEIIVRGVSVKVQKGCVYMPLSTLAERWKWDRRMVKRFIEKLVMRNKVYNKTGSGKYGVSNCISILNYESYFENFTEGCTIKRTIKKKNSRQKEDDAQLNAQLNVQLKEERKETKKKKSPTPPIKEINKEKKKENFADNIFLTKNITAVNAHACTHEEESTLSLTPETPTENKPTKKKSEEEYTVTYKARLIFDKIYTEKNDDKYYWAPKEIKALTDLLKKIKFSREHRKVPLPVDDDSLLAAFEEFINKIQTIWVLEHYTMANINAQYQVIIQDIKNNRNGKSNYQTTAERNRLNSERQKEAIRANVRKLDESRERWLKERKQEGSGIEGQVSSDDPLGFL